MEEQTENGKGNPQELQTEIKALCKIRILTCIITILAAVPISAGIMGGTLWGVFSLLCLMVPQAKFLPVVMGIAGAVPGVILAVHITCCIYKSMGKEIQKKNNQLKQCDASAKEEEV